MVNDTCTIFISQTTKDNSLRCDLEIPLAYLVSHYTHSVSEINQSYGGRNIIMCESNSSSSHRVFVALLCWGGQ